MALKAADYIPVLKLFSAVDFPADMTIGGSSVVALSTVTSTSSNALTVGANGTTNPALNVDASASSAATGINIVSAAASSGVAIVVLSSTTNEQLKIDAKGSGKITLGTTSTGNIELKRNTDISAKNIITDTSTGTIIATGTTQKLGFFNASPVAQQSTTGTVAGFTAGASTAVLRDSTFTGNSGSTAYTIGDVVLALKNLGFLAA